MKSFLSISCLVKNKVLRLTYYVVNLLGLNFATIYMQEQRYQQPGFSDRRKSQPNCQVSIVLGKHVEVVCLTKVGR